jgi:hypothetical protein
MPASLYPRSKVGGAICIEFRTLRSGFILAAKPSESSELHGSAKAFVNRVEGGIHDGFRRNGPLRRPSRKTLTRWRRPGAPPLTTAGRGTVRPDSMPRRKA